MTLTPDVFSAVQRGALLVDPQITSSPLTHRTLICPGSTLTPRLVVGAPVVLGVAQVDLKLNIEIFLNKLSQKL